MTTLPIKGKRDKLLRRISRGSDSNGDMSVEQAGNILQALDRLGVVEIEEEPEALHEFGDYGEFKLVRWPSTNVFEIHARGVNSSPSVLWSSEPKAPLRDRILSVMQAHRLPTAQIADAAGCSIEETIGTLNLALNDGLVGGTHHEGGETVWFRAAEPQPKSLRIRILKSLSLAPCNTTTLFSLHHTEVEKEISRELLRMQGRGEIINRAPPYDESIWSITENGRKALIGT